MFVRRTLLSLALVTAVTACGPEIPNHTHPEPQPPAPPAEKLSAKIVSFSVEPASIKKGETAKLKWESADALSVAVRERSGKGVQGVDSAALSGEVEVTPDETTTYVLHAIGEGGSAYAIAQLHVADEALEIPEAPLLLSAMPDQIVAGQKTGLVWSGPAAVVITDDKNNTIPTGSEVSGSVELTPAETTTYTAKSGKQEVSTKVIVKPAINRFFATPAGASAGQTLTLQWLTAGATEVKVSERTRGDLFTAPANLRNEGSFEDTIPSDLPNGSVLEYALTVQNADGISTQTLTVTVSVVPTITEFTGQSALTRGGTTMPKLSWKTTGAARVTIFAGRAGTTPNDLVFVAPSSQLSTGSVELPLPTESTDYELIAEAAQGGQISAKHSLKVVSIPEIPSFTITPDTITNPGETAQVQWTTTGGVTLTISPVGGSSTYSTTESADILAGSTTITAGNTTVYELSVTNEAGDTTKQTRTLTVTNPIGFTYSPPIAVPGQQVTMNWDFPGATNVIGAPVGETSTGPEPFIELTTSATAKELTTLGATSTAKVEKLVFPDGFKFRHFGVVHDSVQVTNRGWVSFAAAVTPGNITATIPASASPNNFIAAWAGETLSNGKVYWELQGSAPERELVIQWDKFSTSTTGSSLTFELVLFESGMVQMRYKEMNGAGSNVTIGMEDASGSVGYASSVAAAPAANDAITFNGAGLPRGSATFTTGNSTLTYGMLVSLGSAKVPVEATLQIVPQGSLNIPEVMYKPLTTATAGQWVELRNQSGMTLDLKHFSLKTSAGTFPLPTYELADGEYLVLAQSADPSANGDTAVDLVVPGLVLDQASDAVELLLGTGVVSRLSYNDARLQLTEGAAVAHNSKLFPKLCPASAPYGTAGSLGTPGAAGGGSCEVAPITIAGGYTNIASTGVMIHEDEYESRFVVDFPAGFSFPFDGANFTKMLVGNGYISFDLAQGASEDDNFKSIPALFPDPAGIKGVIAPLWQRHELNYEFYSRIYVGLVSDPDANPATPDGRLIVQWSGMAPYGYPYAYVNYQAWLFEDGSVEFHYGDMYEEYDSWFGELYGLVDGSDAAIGITNLTNSYGTVFGYKQAKVNHNMAVRFAAE